MQNFSASALLEVLTNHGCRVWTSDARLRLSDPKGVLTDALRAEIGEHKAELLELLRSEPANDPTQPSAPEYLWLEAQGQRPTTLPLLRQALGMSAARTENRPSYLTICSRCHGTTWGGTGRTLPDGCEVWHCLTCAT